MEAAGEYPAEINMGLTEILLILLGILAFVGSFVIPENIAKNDTKEIRIPEEKIKELVQSEVKQAAFQIEEKTDETISAAAEKTERYMERLSNEKIMAIQEYSDTVLSQINKNHEEAVFLYDMLNNKHVQLKNTAAELNNQMQDMKTNIEQTIQVQLADLPAESVLSATEMKCEASEEIQEMEEAAENTVENTAEMETQLETDSDVGSNKSMILKLHEEGKSNIEIAKSLGLGIGEVKLIIDLFENGE